MAVRIETDYTDLAVFLNGSIIWTGSTVLYECDLLDILTALELNPEFVELDPNPTYGPDLENYDPENDPESESF